MHLAMRAGANDDAYGRAAAARAERAARIGLAAGGVLAAGGSIAWAANAQRHVGPIMTLWGLMAVGTSVCVANTRSAFRCRQAEILEALSIGAAAGGGSGPDGGAEIIEMPQRSERRGDRHAI